MGKGDKRSKKGKITIGSYGVSRPRTVKNTSDVASTKTAKAEPKAKKAEPKAAAKPAAAKKAPAKKKTEE
jgi:30S ribosomal protein S31